MLLSIYYTRWLPVVKGIAADFYREASGRRKPLPENRKAESCPLPCWLSAGLVEGQSGTARRLRRHIGWEDYSADRP